MPGAHMTVAHKGRKNVYLRRKPKIYKFKTKYARGRPRFNPNRLYIPRSPPTTGFIKFRYVQKIASSSNGGAGLPGVYQFRLNSINDPDLTGGGHQPLMHDQIMGVFFGAYLVHGATVTIKAIVDQASEVVIYGTYDNSTVLEEPWKHIEESNKSLMRYYHKPALQPRIIFKKYFSNAKIFGITKEQYRTSGDYVAATGADPARTAYLNIVHQAMVTSNTNVLDAIVEIVYHTQCYKSLDLAQS